ncbi:leucyl/phenylalanyl-tRNA--protein transferase [Colwellia sp. E150_009]|jgi:leucyl/phenylalanyl-tRNA--protein transferase
MLYQLNEDNFIFPPVSLALTEPNGLLAVGGDLQSKRLISAYSQGIFPWFSEDDPLMWWSPDPRAIINRNDLRINKTLRKVIRKAPYTITLNTAFEQVIKQCANAPFRDDGTWILPKMQSAYINLHKLGFAHSIEVWQTINDDKTQPNKILVGGLYGVAINGLFSGESMFYSKANASKLALIALSNLLHSIKIDFIDCQLLNPFLADMGAVEVSRNDFILRKQMVINKPIKKNFWMSKELSLVIYE